MASYTKRGNGWQARVSWVDSLGKRHFKNKQGFKTKTLAKKWAVDNENQLNRGVEVDKTISLSDYFKYWVKTYKEPVVSDVSMVRYRTVEKNILDFFGNTNIKDINRTRYQEFINDYGATHAPSSVQKVNGFIRASVQSAILDDYLIKDFTQGVALVSNKDKVKKVEYLNVKEIKQLLNASSNKLSPHFTSRYMIITAIYTGMRLSEIQALTWNDVDFLHQTINIDKSWDSTKHQFKRTKNKSSIRVIPVNEKLLQILAQLKSNNSTMIFTDQYRTIPSSGAVNNTLRSVLKSLNIKRRTFHFHSLRNSHVALVLADGIDIYAISKRLGHSNITTTANTYAYLIDEYKAKTNQQIINALNAL